MADAADRPFPTCACVSRRYCGEACQAEDWAAGHSETCASGYLHLAAAAAADSDATTVTPPQTPPRASPRAFSAADASALGYTFSPSSTTSSEDGS